MRPGLSIFRRVRRRHSLVCVREFVENMIGLAMQFRGYPDPWPSSLVDPHFLISDPLQSGDTWYQ